MYHLSYTFHMGQLIMRGLDAAAWCTSLFPELPYCPKSAHFHGECTISARRSVSAKQGWRRHLREAGGTVTEI